MKVFVIAMTMEARPVLREMDDVAAMKFGDIPAVIGRLYGEKTAVVTCGVGKVNAAMGAQLAIDKFGADVIINLGVAGGLNDGVKIGEIYAVSETVQFDVDLVQINGTPLGTLNEFQTPYLPLTCGAGFEQKKVATADRFNDDRRDYLLLKNVFGADIRDMECAAIAQVCAHNKKTMYAYKIISDLAGNGSSTEQYKRNIETCFKTEAERLYDVLSRSEKA